MMRTLHTTALWLSPLLAFLFSLPNAAADGGGQGTGNGGDAIAQEFYAIGKVITKVLVNDPRFQAKFPEVDAAKLDRAIESTIVRGTDDVLRDQFGNEKTAVNFQEEGKAFIRVRRAPYNALPTLLRQRLVFHEYLGVLGLEISDDYHISNRLDEVLSRPLYGLCEARRKRVHCSIGLRFDPSTRSLDGAYTCHHRNGSLLNADKIGAENAEWKAVRIWPGYGSTSAGFAYADSWMKFQVPSSPTPGERLPFTLQKRSVNWGDGPDEWRELSGSCILQYD